MTRDTLSETVAVYDRLGATYADKVAHVRLPQLYEFTSMLPHGAVVLDAGCAAGRDSALLKEKNFHVVGIDLSESFLALARERVLGVEFCRMDARALAFEPKTFDGIWSHAMLLNLDRADVPVVLREFHRVLKDGGICYVGVKEGSGERFVSEPLVENHKRHETYFRQSEMENLFAEAGFQVVTSYLADDILGRSTTKWMAVFARKF